MTQGILKIVLLVIGMVILQGATGKSAWASAATSANAYLPLVNQVSARAEISARKGGFLSPLIFKRIERAQGVIERGDLTLGIERLRALVKKTKARPFEQAQVLQSLGLALAQAEKFGPAIKKFEQALNLKVLPLGPTQYMTYNLVQLLLNNGKIKRAEVKLRVWFALVEAPTAEAYILMAQIFGDQKNVKAALANVEQALIVAASPKEMWLRFAVGLYLEQKNYPQAKKWLKVLVQKQPRKKDYWKQLSGVYLGLGDQKGALATLELAQKWGHLTESKEWINLSSLSLMGGVPIKAVKFLKAAAERKLIKQDLKYYELLAHSWIQSEEWRSALPALKQAAALSGQATKYIQLGQLQMELAIWPEAIKSFKRALALGKLSQVGKALMGLGMSHYHNDNKAKALAAFQQIKAEDASFNAAKQWIQFI